MSRWIYGIDFRQLPLWQAIVAGLENAARTGQIRVGDTLPSQRLLADLIGVHVNTVNRAMREAARRGLVSARTGRGTTLIACPAFSVPPLHQPAEKNKS